MNILQLIRSSHIASKACFSTHINLKQVNELVIVGAGVMGIGFAQVALQNDYKVALIDQNSNILEKSQTTILNEIGKVSEKNLKKMIKAEKN